MSIRLRLQLSYKTVFDQVIRWNLFDSRSPDPLIIRREILSTRLYIILVIISLIILTTYISITNQIETRTITFPSQSVYENFQKKYSDSLQCVCTKLSIPYGKFVQTIPKFHQVCSSDFISQKWIDFIFRINITSIMPIDVRTSLSTMFQLIRSFCQSATNTTIDILNQFDNFPLINPILLTKQILTAKVQTTSHLLHQTTAPNFIQSMLLAHKMAQANQLITGLLTNYVTISQKLDLPTHENHVLEAGIHANIYKRKNSTIECSCKDHGSCPLPGNLYFLSGIIVDCLPIQTTLSSSLECFYNQSCLNILLSTYQTKFNISILNRSILSRFNSKTIIESLVKELFIEEIVNLPNYSEYYSTCLPYSCTYTYFHQFNWISVLTMIIALFGGITAVLSIITPGIIQLILFVKQRVFSKKSHQEHIQRDETIRIRLKKLFVTIKIKIIKFNLYDSNSRNPTRIYHGLLATRLYVILLFISICICIFTSDLSNQIITAKLINPSTQEYEQLEKQYSSTLTCSCTEVMISYKDIINIEVRYHQICSSYFIQSSWYQRFSSIQSFYSNIDFLYIASSYFQTLETFCHIANETIHDTIQRFLIRNLINSHLLTNDLFYSQINSSVNAFKQLTITEFLYRINLTKTLIHSNQYLSRTITSTRLTSVYQYLNKSLDAVKMFIYALYTTNTNDHKCYCVIDSTCHLDKWIYDGQQHYPIDWQLEGIHGGCSIIDTVMRSSLICWFNQDCMNKLRKLVSKIGIPIPDSTILLDPSLSSRYFPNTSIETIFNEIMIEEWKFSSSYENFYSKCKPLFCSFTCEKKTNMIHIITILISLIGGINTILRLIVPWIIKIIFKVVSYYRSLQTQTEHQEVTYHEFNLINRLINKLLILNIFDDESDHLETIRRQRISTRVYILVFSIAMYVITLYTIFSNRIELRSYSNPSPNDYDQLLMTYSESLKCPCEKISIEYKYFIEINTTIHAVCSSDFISRKWIDYLFDIGDWYEYDRRDIRVRGGPYFLFLSTLCQLSQITIQNAIQQFLNETFISTHMISISEFDIQMNNINSQFRNNTLIKFSRTLKLLRDIINGNAFVSSYCLNWYWYNELDTVFNIHPIQPVQMTKECSCGTQSDCVGFGGVYHEWYNTARLLIPGWKIGCSVVETVLRSTLQCFYDQICLNSLVFHIQTYTWQHSDLINISAMNFSNKSHFKRETIIEKIADQLFIEEWIVNTSYLTFYNQCNIQECWYTMEKDDYITYTISNILGLYGGLTIALRFSIPYLIQILFKIRDRCRTNTVTSNG
ncbi:hypothetical protein I4U23_012329 [Adineta vaga]|nr:hypothetical protein I4U23_012329 [Adineta vaga]